MFTALKGMMKPSPTREEKEARGKVEEEVKAYCILAKVDLDRFKEFAAQIVMETEKRDMYFWSYQYYHQGHSGFGQGLH